MKDEILALAKRLISVPSVSGDTKNAVKVLEIAKKSLSGHEFTPFASNNYPSLLFSNKGKNIKKFKIILNAHLDVVPAEKKQFKPLIKDGRLYGRGAFDMKAAAAVEILLYKELASRLSFPLGLQLTMDEETSGLNGTGYQVDQGVRGEFVIIGECNSNFQVTNQSKGRKIIKITIKGDSAHSAHPWRGENAIWEMYNVLEPIIKAYPIPEKETYETTVTITRIETGNNVANRIPDDCTAILDVRFTEKDKKTILPKLRSLLPDNIILEAYHSRPTHFVNTSNNYIKQLREIASKKIVKNLPLRFAHATSDATFYSAVGCNAVEFGPIGQSPHHENEWVDIQSLVDYYHILKSFLLQVDHLDNEDPISKFPDGEGFENPAERIKSLFAKP